MADNKKKQQLRVCLAGNPNTGKTTVFNGLTGAKQKVGNYSGVTVEKYVGYCKHRGQEVEIVDLPGTYSLNARSEDERVARNYLIQEKPDAVVQVVDATNLERNLYLAVQLHELGVPLILALNMSDELEKQQINLDVELLGRLLGVPVVSTIGHKRQGLEQLLDEVLQLSNEKYSQKELHFENEIEEQLATVIAAVSNEERLQGYAPDRWLALRVLEDDSEVKKKLVEMLGSADADEIVSCAQKAADELQKQYGEDVEILITEQRYGIIHGVLQESLHKPPRRKMTLSDRIDKVLLSRVLGLPIFGLIMYLVFYISVDVASPLIDLVDSLFGALGAQLNAVMPEGALRSLVVDGIIGGVGGVMVFVPQIVIMFLCIAVLEATGYMARAAFVVDRLMHKIGLHGKSFIPMLIGFGCNVPALMAARTLENEKDRLTTMIATPFMSCGARFPVYLLLAGAFFAERFTANIIFGIYLLGIAVAIGTAKLFRLYVYKGESTPFVMELPPYRLPTVRGVFHQMWHKAGAYLKKAGTVILAAAILVWWLTSYPGLDEEQKKPFKVKSAQIEQAAAQQIGQMLQQQKTVSGVSNEQQLLQNKTFTNTYGSYLKLEQQYLANAESAGSDRKGYLHALKNHKAAVAGWRQARPQMAQLALAYHRIVETRKRAGQQVEFNKNALARENSYAGRAGKALAPLLKPLGLDDWKVSVALIAGFAAKEIVVGTLGSIYALGDEQDESSVTLKKRLLADPFYQKAQPVSRHLVVKQGDGYVLRSDPEQQVMRRDNRFYLPDRLKAIVLMVFVLLYLPCQAVIGVYVKEAGWKNTMIMLGYSTFVAYFISMIVYQGGRLLGV